MENSKLTDLLKTFSETEIKDFEKFLQSPYFTKGRDLTSYYKFLIRYYPDFNISKSELIKKFYKKSDIADSKKDSLIRTYNWELLKFAEEFITFDSIKNNKGAYDDFFIVALLRKELAKRSEQVYKEMDEYQNNHKMDHYVFMNRMFLQSNGVAVKRLNGKRNETLPLFQSQSENLLNFFLHHAEHLLLAIKTNKNLFKTGDTSYNIREFLSSIDFEKYFAGREGFENDLEIQKMAIYSILITLDNGNFKRYVNKLIESFKKNIPNFGKEGLLHISGSIINYLSERNETEYVRMKFDLIKYTLEHDIYFDNNYRNVNTFKYMRAVNTALNLNEINWTEKFAEEYAGKLIGSQRENMKIYSKAHIEFANGNYEKSLMLISEFDMFDMAVNFQIKKLHLKNLYKLSFKDDKYFETTRYFSDSFKHYLMENCKVSDKNYEAGMNFLEGINILLQYNFASEKKKYDVMHKMESYALTASDNWLQSEMNAIPEKIKRPRKKTV